MQMIPPGAIEASYPPAYRDQQLQHLIKALRAAVRAHPPAKLALKQVEKRLQFLLRVIESWDASHAERAELLIGLGQIAAANSVTQMIFDATLRRRLLARCLIGGDAQAAERMEAAIDAEREVLA